LLSIGDGVICTDKNYNVTFINRVTESVTGWTQKEAFGISIYKIFTIINEHTRKNTQHIINQVMTSGKTHFLANHTILITRNETEVLIEDSVAPILDDTNCVIGVVIVFRDFTEKWERLKKIEFLAQYDQLTGLYNRGYYETILNSLDTKGNLPLTLIMSDVNGLKLINDTFGHSMGDELLKKTANVIKREIRPDDIVARLGGDEFIVILPKTDAYEAERIIKRIKDLLSKEKVSNIEVSISFGYETKIKDEESIQEIFKIAENNMYKKKLFERPSMRGKTVGAILNTLYEKNKREEKHSLRVSELCVSLGEVLGLSEQKIEELKSVGLLHDIGKIAIAENILNKPGKLTEIEKIEMNRHPEIGYRILRMTNDLSEIALYVLAHHERWDGKGYPRGLKGEDIPFASRIIAVADAYDAMTSVRSYRNTLPEKVVIEELHKNAGTQLDPNIVRIFVERVLNKEW
jgi:diguanylate cyclase (GGDEF)-like protein/PAS domain S-box-containing protein